MRRRSMETTARLWTSYVMGGRRGCTMIMAREELVLHQGGGLGGWAGAVPGGRGVSMRVGLYVGFDDGTSVVKGGAGVQ